MCFVINNDEIPCRFFDRFFSFMKKLSAIRWVLMNVLIWLCCGTEVSLTRFCLCFQDIHVKFHPGLKCMPLKMLYKWTYEHNKYILSDIYTGISMCHRLGFLKVILSSSPLGMILTSRYYNLNRLDNIHVRQCCDCVGEVMLIQYVCDILFASTILKNGVNNRT